MRRETTTPALVRVDDAASLTTLLRDRATSAPDRAFCEYKADDGAWVSVTLARFAHEVARVAKGLIAMGVVPRDNVGLLASTRYEWVVVDYAIQAAGAVTVPIYATSSAAQIAWVCEDARISLAVVENRGNAAVCRALHNAPAVLTLDGDDPAIGALRRTGEAVTDEELASRTADVRADDVATIVYTSGTTGRPKGVELTHRNFIEHALNAASHEDFGALAEGDSRILLFLPLAHVFARFAQVLALACGSVAGFTPSVKTLGADLRSFRPTWILAVPRVLETFYNLADATAGRGAKQRLFRWAAEVSREWSAAAEGAGPSSRLRVAYRVADALVLRRVRAALGGRLKYVVAGGSRLSPRIGHFFSGVGVTVMEGYGSTELSAPVTCNPPGHARIGTVGIPFPGCTVRIAEDGEVLAQGPNVFAGYLGHPEATAAVMRDGWFATGDLGAIDADGYLTITGRKKEILVTSGGKNVQPAGLEDAIRPYPLVQEVVVVGDGQPFVSALISFDEVLLPRWLASKGLPTMSVAEAAAHPVVRAHLQAVIDAANSTVSRAEGIGAWRVLSRELTEARDELSASLKVRRAAVTEHFADVIAEIYAPHRQAAS